MTRLRLATPADHDAIWGLLSGVFRAGDTYAVDPGITRDAALDLWCTTPAATYVAEDQGRVVGTYYIRTNKPGGGAHICNCGYIVSPDARGQGLAAQMCVASQTQARAMGYTAMQFNFVLTSNAGAVRLWDRLGFATVGRIPDAFILPGGGVTDALVMYKSL